MRIPFKMNLGVFAKKDLRSPSACLDLGRQAGRVADALAFVEYYLSPARGKLDRKEFGHIFAGLSTSANSAEALGKLGLPDELAKKAKAYERAARSVNKKVWAIVDGNGSKGNKKPSGMPAEEAHKALDEIKSLRVKANEIVEEVKELCVLRKRLASMAGNSGNTGNAGNVIKPRIINRTPIIDRPRMIERLPVSYGRVAMGAAQATVMETPNPSHKTIYPKFSRPAFYKNPNRRSK